MLEELVFALSKSDAANRVDPHAKKRKESEKKKNRRRFRELVRDN
jgi:hypothetical protein